MSDVLAFEAGITNIDPEKKDDIQEVINYRRAVILAEKMLKELPLTGRVLCAAHDVLLRGVRGELKSPGRYRFDQVWIGPNNYKEDARYMPPEAKDVPNAMARWERFVNNDEVTPLVKAAIAHAEFESIHPFADGNGRMGRIVIPLMLEMDGVISSPCFYLSEFFEHRTTEYQDRLLAVSEEDAWTEWCIFFLDAVATQAKENNRKANGIYSLYKNTLDFLMTTVRSDNAATIAPHLFRMAIFPASIFTKEAGLNQSTAKRLVRSLKKAGIIVEILPHRGSSPAVLAFPELLRIVDGVEIAMGHS
jgi:Fic family protein